MNQSNSKLRNGCLFVFILYVVSAVLFWIIAKDQLLYKVETSSMLSPLQTVGEITKDVVIEQDLNITGDEVIGVALQMATYARDTNRGKLTLELLDGQTVYGSAVYDVSQIVDNSLQFFEFDRPISGVQDKVLTLRLTSDSASGYGVTVMYGNSISTLKGGIDAQLKEEQYLRINGEVVKGQLCAQITTKTPLWYGPYYAWFALGIGVFLAGYLLHVLHCERIGASSVGQKIVQIMSRYGFLVQQLVSRDFKNKYKRSVLGMLWSFLNPLLTTLVQYVVFSSIFKTNTENFVVYLLTGTIFFNFFSEASNMAMSSIVSNSSLITKVYVPKYIYPLSRILSSGVNFAISMIPWILVILVTGVRITPAILLVIFPIICTMVLAMGMGLLLSAIMVFFRDTQFLYGVVLTILMYLTPIFYPVTIIPEQYRWLFLLNPISNNIVFARSCILDGIFPGMPMALLCLGYSLAILVLGSWVFKRTQDRFILHI